MGALVEHKFEKGFILDEQRLRKIKELIEIRLQNHSNPTEIKYRVSRGDAFTYETPSIETVINEDNDDWRAISRLEIIFEETEKLKFELKFSSNGAYIEIIGEDRDAVFLLFSDIKQYITNEVLSKFHIPPKFTKFIPIAIFTIIASIIIYNLNGLGSYTELADKAISSNSIEEKLNFLIQDKKLASPSSAAMRWSLALILIPFISLLGVGDWVTKQIAPTNLFLFGSRKEKYERQKGLREKVIWGILVGLAVSLIASYIFQYAPK